jgi:DNA invertase Pin-like site-specific DNA recombinase
MSRSIIPGARLVQEFIPLQPQLPTDKAIVQYVRQSTLGQVKNNRQSAILQDEQLGRRLVAYGWQDIIKIDTDQGKSGQKRRDERAGLDRTYRLIEHREVGAVAAFDPSRLYRDLTRVYYTDFVSLLETHGIPLVTYSQVYWPTRKDMDALIDRFKEAANFIDEVINGKLKPARLQAIEESVSYGGGAVPIGYIIGETVERKYYVVYEPHARLVRWLFKRFHELEGNLSRLGRDLRDTGFSFPAFSGVERIPHVALRWGGNGYPLRTRDALVSILTNVAYIGYYLYNGVLVSREAHEGIVPMDDFLYAYNRLSATTLDGDVNEHKPKVDRRYGVGIQALLEGVLESDGRAVYAMAHSQGYEARTDSDGWKTTDFLIRTSVLDSAFSKALVAVLDTLELRHRQGLQDSLYERMNEIHEAREEAATSLEVQLVNIDRAIRRTELDKRVALEEEYEQGVRDATKQLKRLHADRSALEAKAEQASSEASELEECQTLLECACQQWENLAFERQRRLVRMLVARANLVEVAPHVVRLDVWLGEPLNCLMVEHIYRQQGSRPGWTGDEEAVLRAMYPRADRAAILQALPTRAWKPIVARANELGLSRESRRHTPDLPVDLAHADMTLMEELGMTQDSPHWSVSEGHACTMISHIITGSMPRWK